LCCPSYFFVIVILLGAILLHGSEKNKVDALSWTDAAFTATSAACVTGLVVVDTGSYFTQFGQAIILFLMQIGGLGIMTFTSLSIYIWRRRTTITDRIAVGQILLHDATFNLGRFLIEIVCWTFVIEAAGAVLLCLMDPVAFPPSQRFSIPFPPSAMRDFPFPRQSHGVQGQLGGQPRFHGPHRGGRDRIFSVRGD
jgi:trk system potassium uptake protein TrkH